MKIGIDLGGSHVAVALVKDDNKIIYKIEQDLKGEDISELIIQLMHRLLNENNINIYIRMGMITPPIEKVGICIPGTIANGVIVKSGNLGLKGYEIQSKLQKEFPMLHIQIRNDGKCAALAEKKLGSLKKYSDCIFTNIGTGIGGAAFISGRLLEPKRYTGFEFGHMVIEKNGKQCTCGKKGCFETYCSIRALKEQVKEKLNIQEDITGKELKRIIEENLSDLEEVIDEYTDNLSIGIGNLIDIFEPEAICIGGSFVHYEDILLDRLINKLKGKTFNEGELPVIVMAELQNDAGILGAV